MLRLAKGVTIPNDIKPAEWLLHSLPVRKRCTGTPVESVIPNVFDEYARVFHPSADDQDRGTPSKFSQSGRVKVPVGKGLANHLYQCCAEMGDH
ncbi:hypothetical protein [Desulfosporosinus sp. FKA]|uniref:hypothetical protein n=1 Tax=Desulfosporosinus sp. FKA TaxID=1969834 RepID=UPI000B499123|nr:hypothetical protein [Desulfosporosinus sp. FKA]